MKGWKSSPFTHYRYFSCFLLSEHTPGMGHGALSPTVVTDYVSVR